MQGGIAVSVDADFARFGNKSYAINKINSVEVRARRPFGPGWLILWGGLTAISAVMAYSLGRADWLLFGGVAAFFAYRAWKKSKTIEYQLFLMTSSSEAQALVSRDGGQIQGLRDRIEKAMAGQLAR